MNKLNMNNNNKKIADNKLNVSSIMKNCKKKHSKIRQQTLTNKRMNEQQ